MMIVASYNCGCADIGTAWRDFGRPWAITGLAKSLERVQRSAGAVLAVCWCVHTCHSRFYEHEHVVVDWQLASSMFDCSSLSCRTTDVLGEMDGSSRPWTFMKGICSPNLALSVLHLGGGDINRLANAKCLSQRLVMLVVKSCNRISPD